MKLFKNMPWHMLPVIFSLAWPTMLEQLMQTAVQYIDTAMVGSLGTEATAAIGGTTTINWLIGSTISAISVGFLAYISQAKGAGDIKKAKKASSQAVLAVIISGLFFTLITLGLSPVIPLWMQMDVDIRETASQYFFIIYLPMLFRAASIIFGTILRAVGDTKTPMLAGIWVNVSNVLLNFFLIYESRVVNVFGADIYIPGAGLKVIGAGLASAISFVLGGVIISIALWKHPIVSPEGESFKPDMMIIKPCVKVAFPNALQRFGTSLGYVVFAAMVNSIGETSTAAHTIANTVESAFYIPGYGMQTAAATLAGNALGAKDEKKVMDLSKMILFIEVLLMIFSGAMLFIFAPNLMSIFSKDPEVINLGTIVLRMVACSEPFYGVSIIVEGMMQGMGKTVMPFVCNVTGMWVFRIVGTFICTQLFSFGLISAWACMILHNFMMFVMFFIYYVTGRWVPKEKFKN